MSSTELENKICAKYLQQLCDRYGATNPILIRPDKRHPAFVNLDQKMCSHLQEHGWGKMERLNKSMLDENGVPRQFDLTSLRLLDPAVKFLEGCKVTMEQHTDTKVTLEPTPEEEPAWKTTKRTRDFVRTERGNMIVTMCPEALESDIRGHLARLRDPKAPKDMLTVHRIWLTYELNWRWSDISPGLRHEMEDFRDLPVPSRRKTHT